MQLVEIVCMGFTYAVQTVDGDSLERSPHHRVFFQHLIEVVDRQRVESAVRLRSHAGCSSTPRQQADL